MKIRAYILAALAAVMLCVTAQAQDQVSLVETSESDVQLRLGAGLEVPIGRKWEFTWNEQARLHNNLANFDKIISSVGFGYKPWKFLKLEAQYGFVNERTSKTDNDTGFKTIDWQIRHRLNFDVTGSVRLGAVKLSLRERVRVQFRGDSVNKYEHPNPEITLRSRLKGAVDLRNGRWEPYAFAEVYTTLNAPAAVVNYLNSPLKYSNYINRVRLGLGTEMKLSNSSKLDFYYMVHFNRSYEARYKGISKDPTNDGDLKSWKLEKKCAHVIGIDYKFKL
ncbi:MAG: DUF2490 domain-containing protein [Alistipes sp.]|jgi:hypothetical protein|nr:DUF2490 domain-containing protein [Alistipes sp.]